MDGWLDGWMDGWMDDWMDGWIIDRCRMIFTCRYIYDSCVRGYVQCIMYKYSGVNMSDPIKRDDQNH